MCVHLASYPFLIGEYLSVTMPLCLYLFVLLLLLLAFLSFPRRSRLLGPLRSLRSPFVPSLPPSFPLRSLASQVPAGCVGGGSRCPLSSAIRAEWCVRVSSIDDGIDGIDDNRFDNRGDGGDGGKEEGGY